MMQGSATYLLHLRERQASVSVGPSTARRMGPKGTIQAARAFLAKVQLERFQLKSEVAFIAELDRATKELMRSLPEEARKWGSARKFLNIFLRECAYNKYLSVHHKLHRIEAWLEVPLDSHVVKKLKKKAGRGALPRWDGVIHLTPEQGASFQAYAATVALEDGVNRVDLDVKYWRRSD